MQLSCNSKSTVIIYYSVFYIVHVCYVLISTSDLLIYLLTHWTSKCMKSPNKYDTGVWQWLKYKLGAQELC